MKTHAGVGLFQLAARVVFLLLLLVPASATAQAGKDRASNEEEEKFKPVDPWTKGDPALVKQAGYRTIGPFSWGEGIQAQDVVDVLGGIELLWVETPHFKLCSSLQTYKSKGDQRENTAIEKELEQLTRLVAGFKTARPSKLDPWLRLHLYAQRLERLYADFCERTGFRDEDFPALGSTSAMGNGPFLGQKLKPVIFLAEKSSAIGRINKRYGKLDETTSQRFSLPGGALFFGIAAETLRENGYESDGAFYCAVVENVVCNMLDGLRDSLWATPLWFDIGMGHWFSRRIDERYPYFAADTSRFIGDKTHDWQPRVRGLVENKFAYSWNDMLTTLDWAQFTPQSHMLNWSRVDWMMQQKPEAVRKFLESVTVALPQLDAAKLIALQVTRAKAGLAAGFGKTPEECEAAWTAWVLKTYEKK